MKRMFPMLFLMIGSVLPAADWPQWMGRERDGIWDEPGLAAKVDPARAELLWSAPVGGGYAGPAVAGGKVYVMSCHRDEKPADTSKGLPGEEQLLCLDAATGKVVWEQRWPVVYKIDYASGPRATPTLHGGKVYALGAEGHLVCADAETGAILWMRDFQKELPCPSPTWGFAGHPLVFEDKLICLAGGEGSTVVALDLANGQEKWRALSSKQAGYCPPQIIQRDGQPQLILWHGEALNALDPRTGRVHWTMPRETRFGVSMASPVVQGDRLLVSAYWWGSRMLQLKPDNSLPDILWETQRESDTRTEHLNALMCTPLLVDGFLYGVCSQGQLRCLEWLTGQRRWETLEATGGKADRWVTAFLTRLGSTGNEFVIFNEQGELIRARLTPERWQEKSRKQLVTPNSPDVKNRTVVWSHPAYANGCAFVRNDGELRCWRLVPTG